MFRKALQTGTKGRWRGEGVQWGPSCGTSVDATAWAEVLVSLTRTGAAHKSFVWSFSLYSVLPVFVRSVFSV